MAERKISIGSFKEQFDDQLTCSVCQDQYTYPKTLPCLHSFCLKCIKKLPKKQKSSKYCINCPTCRADHLLPQGGATELPNAFHINSLFDLQKQIPTQNTNTTSDSRCSEHNDPLKVFCETCSQVICCECALTQQHNKHKFYLISECYDIHHQQILANLDLLKHNITDTNAVITHLSTAEREVLQQGQDLKKQINTHAQQLIHQIQTSRKGLLQQLDTIVQQKTQLLSTQKEQAQNLHTKLNSCQQIIEQSLKEWTKQQILENKQTILDEMDAVSKYIDPTMTEPLEKPDIELKQINAIENEIGLLTSTTFGKATATVIHGYQAENDDEVTLEPGDTITNIKLEIDEVGWWSGDVNGKKGFFPSNFVELNNQ